MTPGCSLDQSAWAAYRQALRDIPQAYKEYSKVEWPTQPSKKGPNTK